jgi:hypothetical protein
MERSKNLNKLLLFYCKILELQCRTEGKSIYQIMAYSKEKLSEIINNHAKILLENDKKVEMWKSLK